jgi:hypothetical protein
MKEGRGSSGMYRLVMAVGAVVGVERCSSLYRLLVGRIRLDGSLASGGASP